MTFAIASSIYYTQIICIEILIIFHYWQVWRWSISSLGWVTYITSIFNSFLLMHLLSNFIGINLTFDTHASHCILLEALHKHTPLWIQVAGKLLEINFSILLVNTRNVDLWKESDGRRSCWVLISALNCKHVDAIVKVSVSWSYNSAVPLCESLIITFIKTIWNTSIWKLSLFTFLQLIVELEGSWFYKTHGKILLAIDKELIKSFR